MKGLLLFMFAVILSIVCYIFPGVAKLTWIFAIPIFIMGSGMIYGKLCDIEKLLKIQKSDDKKEESNQ